MTSEPSSPPARTFGIAQLSREFGVTARALRYYEQVGLLSPERRRGAARVYSSRDRERVILILGGRAMGMPLQATGRLFELYEREGDVSRMAKALQVFREEIRALERRRDEVGQAIAMLQVGTERLSGVALEGPAVAAPGRKAARRSRASVSP